jgi:hypothetical protein
MPARAAHPRVQKLRLRAVFPAREDARRLAAGNAHGVAHLFEIQPKQLARGVRGAESADHACWMEADFVELLRRDEPDAAGELVAACDGRDDLTAARFDHFADCKCSGNHRAADMDDGFIVRVVVLKPLRHRAVGERCLHRRHALAAAEDARVVAAAHRERCRTHRFADRGRHGCKR